MNTTNSKPSASFWAISIIALLWNLMGVNQYILMAYKSESIRTGLSAEKLALIDATPVWSTAAFATAVFAGALGCIVLLLRKKLANTLFLVSFFGIIIQNIDAFMRFKISEFTGAEITFTLLIPLIGLFLIWYSKKCISKGWLK